MCQSLTAHNATKIFDIWRVAYLAFKNVTLVIQTLYDQGVFKKQRDGVKLLGRGADVLDKPLFFQVIESLFFYFNHLHKLMHEAMMPFIGYNLEPPHSP